MGTSRSTEHFSLGQPVISNLAKARRASGDAGGRRVTFREDQNTSIYFGNAPGKATRGYVIEPLDDELRTGNSIGPFALTEKNLSAFNKIQMRCSV